MGECGGGSLVWGVAGRPIPGEQESGDGHLVAETTKGWLLAVVDGLGHGPHAAEARRAFIAALQHHAEKPPAELFRLCDTALRATRGCVGSLVAIDRGDGLLSWLGVGNVEGVVLRMEGNGEAFSSEYITSRGGIVGYRLPELLPTSLRLADNDILVLATDGITDNFLDWLNPEQSTELLAAAILNHCAKATDDALVLVARWNNSLPGARESVS